MSEILYTSTDSADWGGRLPDATDIDPAVVQVERRSRISKAQDEGIRWADFKFLLRVELDCLTHRRAQNASKIADSFELSEGELLYYQGQRRCRAEPDSADISLRLVVPTTMIDEVLHSRHNSIAGGHQGIVRPFHRVKPEFDWVGLYADVSKRVQTCEDCITSRSKPHLSGYSPCHVASEYPFHMVSMDFGIPLPAFAELMQSRSRATLSYSPQAKDQQERLVKTMIQTVRAYVKDPLQADWDAITEKMAHGINNSRDTTRRETPLYLVLGWDAQSTLKAMSSRIKKDPATQLTPHNGAEKLTANE
ncbi:unnamed protein product [Phytophthora fragariaefolia]|uniref:Unnamed protein product n=1 Tax=Phytophthora fragariaefolia TaxID=1490495 RepID=A0A9W6U8Q1_9STRA|nr:unnamed protein product [Phytophthora fragariaefolia]